LNALPSSENKHSTDVESPPFPPRVCLTIYTGGESCPNLGPSACLQ
jgi:hypothetical protein